MGCRTAQRLGVGRLTIRLYDRLANETAYLAIYPDGATSTRRALYVQVNGLFRVRASFRKASQSLYLPTPFKDNDLPVWGATGQRYSL